MKRRDFITLVGGAATVVPFAARAQERMRRVGFLTSLGANDRPILAEAFRRGLSEAAYNEGRNLEIEYRFAGNQPGQLRVLADDLVRRRMDVIVATGGSVPAAKAATTEIPIVFTTASDPVQIGLVASLARPAATSRARPN